MSLIHIAKGGRVRDARICLEAGYDPDERDVDGWTPLLQASAKGEYEIVRLLLEYGARIDTPSNNGWTPLIHAVQRYRNIDVVRLLIEKGANTNASNREGQTALMHVVPMGNMRMIRLLLDGGADPHMKDKYRQSALDIALIPEVSNFIKLYPRSIHSNKDRSRGYMDESYEDISISFSPK